MRILNIQDQPLPCATSTSPPSPGPDPDRVEALEKVAKSILQKIQDIEERIKALEIDKVANLPLPSRETGASAISYSAPVPQVVSGRTEVRDGLPPSSETNHPSSPPSPLKGEGVTFDTDALKKGLLTKMWKYLNDQAAA